MIIRSLAFLLEHPLVKSFCKMALTLDDADRVALVYSLEKSVFKTLENYPEPEMFHFDKTEFLNTKECSNFSQKILRLFFKLELSQQIKIIHMLVTGDNTIEEKKCSDCIFTSEEENAKPFGWDIDVEERGPEGDPYLPHYVKDLDTEYGGGSSPDLRRFNQEFFY